MEVIGMGQGGQLPLDLTTNTSGAIDDVSVNKIMMSDGSGAAAGQSRVLQNVNSKNVSIKSAKDAADEVNRIMDETQTHLKFEVYGKFNDIVVQVLDDKTNEVIKEVPPKKLIDMVEKFCEMSGFFMDEKV